MKKFYFLVLLCIVISFDKAAAQLLSFPTAEGAGKFVSGGRGTVAAPPVVLEVTSLADNATAANTPGTFRYALAVNPNPVDKLPNVTHTKTGTASLLKIINAEGKEMKRMTVPGGSVQTAINTASFTAGIYILVFINDEDTNTIKFIKR